MSSRKPSARAKRIAEFKAQTPALDDLFALEQHRQEEVGARREEALREKSCFSKKRYSCRGDAEEAIRLCADHGRTGLRCYKCPYCKGWHLTSKPQ